jgi:hypothetical protein
MAQFQYAVGLVREHCELTAATGTAISRSRCRSGSSLFVCVIRWIGVQESLHKLERDVAHSDIRRRAAQQSLGSI